MNIYTYDGAMAGISLLGIEVEGQLEEEDGGCGQGKSGVKWGIYNRQNRKVNRSSSWHFAETDSGYVLIGQ